MLWHDVIPSLFLIAVFWQLMYTLFVFLRLSFYKRRVPEFIESAPGVSIVVAAWNELENLQSLIPLLESQQYPDFEIIIVDDRSSDGTYDYLLTNKDNFPNVKIVRIETVPVHFTAKKYALTMGIKKASKELILVTDADCRPSSELWVQRMAESLGDKEIVLGYSPYPAYPGGLNALIRYETFQTAVQYLSFALAGIPFMGVGRNLLYRKDFFWANGGFASHYGLLGGDDDLFVNQTANSKNVAICIESDAYTLSEPKRNWKDWFIQKRRHLSVGKKYKFKHKIHLGLLWYGQLFSWFLFIPALFFQPELFQVPDWARIPAAISKELHLEATLFITDWMRFVLGVFMGYILIKWLVFSSLNRRLGSNVGMWRMPYYEFLFTGYLFILGIVTLFTNPKRLRWK
jgi:glycosyltransferase involved in cell wall biosynthesis